MEHARVTRRNRLVAGAGMALGTPFALAPAAVAAEVTTTADTGAGSLREAVADTNGSATDDTITFAAGLSGDTISLTSGELAVTDQLYIEGPGADQLTVDATDSSRHFLLDNGGEEVVIYGLTLTGVSVTGDGGSILNEDSDPSVAFSVLTGNDAVGASNGGGAIADATTATSDTNVYYSTLAGNTAAGDGGAIKSEYATVVVSTMTGNVAGGGGGAISGNLPYVFDSTISGNDASFGGGVDTDVAGGAAYVYSSILANNTADSATAGPDASGDTLLGFSLLEATDLNGGGLGSGPGSITGQDPQLSATLGDFGGPTPTLRPAATSPVVDAGYAILSGDQRGIERPVDAPRVPDGLGGPYDIGAVELTTAELGTLGLPLPGGGTSIPAPSPTPPKSKKKKCKKKKGKKGTAASSRARASKKKKKKKC
jgi:predicted outer membrane repeat protein